MSEKRLGRGLQSLLGSSDLSLDSTVGPAVPQEQLRLLALDLIDADPQQPRKTFDERPLMELANSIQSQGVLQPVMVKPDGARYRLVAGERRWRAARIAGLAQIPAVIRQLSERQSLEASLVENVQREDLNPVEKARAYQELSLRFSMTQEEIASRVGQDRSTVANFLRLLQLPSKILEDVSRGTLTMGHARALLAIEHPPSQESVWQKTVKEGLSVRQTEALAQLLGAARRRREKKPKAPHIRQVEENLRRKFGTRVVVHEGKGKGKIVIEFYSPEDFQRIMAALDISVY